ncbi:MAG: phasin, PhaP [Pseudomonadota bacterium]
MPKTKDPMVAFKEVLKEMPLGADAVETAYRTTASLNEKLAASAIKAVGAAQSVTDGWTKDTLAKVGELTKAKADPADYIEAVTSVAAEQSDIAIKTLTALADITKTCQTETFELFASVTREVNEDAVQTMQSATEKATKAAKKLAVAA